MRRFLTNLSSIKITDEVKSYVEHMILKLYNHHLYAGSKQDWKQIKYNRQQCMDYNALFTALNLQEKLPLKP